MYQAMRVYVHVHTSVFVVSILPLFLRYYAWVLGQIRECCINLYDFDVS